MERQSIMRLMQLLSATYNREMSEELYRAWVVALDDLNDEQIMVATKNLLKTHKGFFPTPADLRQCVPDLCSLDEEAEHAFTRLMKTLEQVGYQSVHFEDDAIAEWVRKSGGWNHLCNQSYDELVWLKKEFLREYPSLRKTGLGYNPVLLSPFSAKGETYFIPIEKEAWYQPTPPVLEQKNSDQLQLSDTETYKYFRSGLARRIEEKQNK